MIFYNKKYIFFNIMIFVFLIFLAIFLRKQNPPAKPKSRICVVFRGENVRDKHGYMSALGCVDNWKETIFDVIDCDVALFTYKSGILDQLKEKLSPVHVCTEGYDSQEGNANAAIKWMIENRNRYDRFVVLRFDFMYRKRIIHWRHWDKKGITLVNKDIKYPSSRLYHDAVFVIDSEWIGHFKKAFEGPDKIYLHHIGRYLEDMKDVPLRVMYPDYYHLTKHVFYAWYPEEPRPHVEDGYKGEKLLDLTEWNECLLKRTQTLQPFDKCD
jgi:hypothetical protein